MSLKRPVVASSLLAFAMAGAGVFLCVRLKTGLEKESRLAAQRLAQTIDPFLRKAHRNADDLLMQEAIQALAGAASVSQAYVLDGEDRVLAHSRVGELGRLFKHTKRGEEVWTFPLRDARKFWGTLVISFGGRPARRFWTKQAAGILSVLGLLWLGLAAASWGVERKKSDLESALANREAVIAEKIIDAQKLALRLRHVQAAWQSCARSAVEHAPYGLALLDDRQRVIAANTAAAKRLGPNAADLKEGGVPWFEIPLLQACGTALEQAMLSPGTRVQAVHSPDRSVLIILTEPDGSGTWLKFSME